MKKLNEAHIFRQSLAPVSVGTGDTYGLGISLKNAGRAIWIVDAGVTTATGTMDMDIEEGVTGVILADADAAQDVTVDLDDTSVTELGVKFTTPNNGGVEVQSIEAQFLNNGTIAGSKNITCTLQAGAAEPSDTDLVTPVNGDIPPDAIGATNEKITFTFDPPVQLAANTVHWVVFEADYTGHATNCVGLSADTVTTGGNLMTHTADWNALVTTQTAVVNVLGIDYTKIGSADLTQITVANDNTIHMIEAPVALGDVYQRPKLTQGTDAGIYGVIVMATPGRTPISQTNTVVSV